MKTYAEAVTVAPLVFTVLIILALIAVGGTAAAVVTRGRSNKALVGGNDVKQLGPGSVDSLLERGFSDMRVGDIMLFDGADFLVEGVSTYDEAGRAWSMAHLVDGKTSYWLLVGLDKSGSSNKSLLQPTSELDINEYPPEVLILGGERYTFGKRGSATVALFGNTGGVGGDSDKPGRAHRCRWWNYQGPANTTILVEQWGDDYRVLAGRSLGATDIEMMPGS